MLPVAEAQAIVLNHARPLPPQSLPLGPAAVGLVLAEDIVSDLDMPPYDKALMDGYAVRSVDVATGQGVVMITEEITAGRTPTIPLGPGQAARIMTGAPLPMNCDAVVPWERTELLTALSTSHQPVKIRDSKPIRPGQNIMPRGQEMRRGQVVVQRGSVLRPQEFGVLATVGRSKVQVHPAPEVVILSTGDEIVDPSEVPGPGQIRNGNGAMLLAQVVRAGGVPRPVGIARDRLDSLRPLVEEGLRSPVLILSGGVSAGKLDLVPGVLQELGVTAHFHKVEMKPGKPVLFGTTKDTLVFGLPGNPVSALVCFELFVRPALRRLAGHAEALPHRIEAALAEDFAYRSDRPTYHPARLELAPEGWRVRPVPWFGSPDLCSVIPANAFIIFPAGDHQHKAGQRFPVLKPEA